MPETVEEIFARRKAALGAPVPAPAGPSAEEVYLRRKANAAAAAAHPPDLAAQDRAMEPPSVLAGAAANMARPFVNLVKKPLQATAEAGKNAGFKVGELLTGGPDPLRRAAADEAMSRLVPTFLDPYATAMEDQAAAEMGDPVAAAADASRRMYQKGGGDALLGGLAEGVGGATTLAFPGITAAFGAPGVGEAMDAAGEVAGAPGGAVVKAAGGGEAAQEVGRLTSKAAAALLLAALTKRVPQGRLGNMAVKGLEQAAPIVGMTAGAEGQRLAELGGLGPGGQALAAATASLGGAMGAGTPPGRGVNARPSSR